MKAEYIDHLGSDQRIVDAARVSFDKSSENYSDQQNQKLIKYLADHNHWTPFSHVKITMRETVPIFVARQRFKHMIGFTYNEVSRRYVDEEPRFFWPDKWRSRPDKSIKQGSGTEEITSIKNQPIDYYYSCFLKSVEDTYKGMLEAGVAPEQARMILPQSMYTSYYVTGSLAAWARAYKLRIDGHAQKEIQDLAEEWDNIISDIEELEVSWRKLLET